MHGDALGIYLDPRKQLLTDKIAVRLPADALAHADIREKLAAQAVVHLFDARIRLDEFGTETALEAHIHVRIVCTAILPFFPFYRRYGGTIPLFAQYFDRHSLRIAVILSAARLPARIQMRTAHGNAERVFGRPRTGAVCIPTRKAHPRARGRRLHFHRAAAGMAFGHDFIPHVQRQPIKTAMHGGGPRHDECGARRDQQQGDHRRRRKRRRRQNLQAIQQNSYPPSALFAIIALRKKFGKALCRRNFWLSARGDKRRQRSALPPIVS